MSLTLGLNVGEVALPNILPVFASATTAIIHSALDSFSALFTTVSKDICTFESMVK